jgi:ribosomal protein L12E/L44/L45/RPP1/RPP2
MITGCNTNILYRGKQFHVQTEDSGRANPHIISHVYHGGTIIASEKSGYADRVDSEEIDIKVRAQIELQHKTMLKRLTGGELDEVIDERLGGARAAAKPPPPRAREVSAAKSAARAGDPSRSSTAGADASGSITSGAATDPSIDVERPVADTEPILGGTSAPRFGNSPDSEKPLDEVILEYLVDKARGRAAEKKRPPARQQRQKG